RLLAERHGDVLGAAEAHADDGRLTGEPTPTKGYQRVKVEALDALDAIAREQHAVVGAEETTLVHGGEVDPVGLGVERILNLWRADAAVVVVIGAPKWVHAVGPQRHLVRSVGCGAAQCGLERDGSALDLRFVADLDVPARHASVPAHGAP